MTAALATPDFAALYRAESRRVLATLIRTCLIAAPGRDICSADFSAIEARVTAWFADCQWRLDVFRTHGKIYEASASTAFKIPMSEFNDYKKRTGKHHPARKKGKVMELALGYQGGPNALITMGALDMGIPIEELDRLFQPFHGTFARGSGLGLAIVHRIVTDYNGEIQVESQVGRGTTVAVRLPARAVTVS